MWQSDGGLVEHGLPENYPWPPQGGSDARVVPVIEGNHDEGIRPYRELVASDVGPHTYVVGTSEETEHETQEVL